MTEAVRTVAPALRLGGALRVPGDKSISHRAAMLGAIAEGESTIRGFLRSEDCLNTLRAMQALGAEVRDDGETIRVRGTGGALHAPAGELDMGNAGTGMRLLTGLLAGQPFDARLTGDASLRSRPMDRIRDPLARMGARIDLLGPDGRTAPIVVHGTRLCGGAFAPRVASAQVKSCILLAGLFADGATEVVEPVASRDHTERMLLRMGAPLVVEGLRIRLEASPTAGPRLRPGDWRVPGDISSAAFWLCAAAACEGAEVTVEGLGLNPRRTALLDVLRRMGADLQVELEPGSEAWEPTGSVTVRGCGLRGVEIAGAEIPNLIDEIPVLAAIATLAEGQTVVRDARELRVKESDRIATTVGCLCALGARAEARVEGDGLIVYGGTQPAGGSVASHGDHRIAMAMAVLALFASGPVEIRDVACVATSYPSFWADLAQLTGQGV